MKKEQSKNQKNVVTLFLERNSIWFKTILSFTMTVAAVAVSIASCSVSNYQNHLTEMDMLNKELKEEPFFSVENIYVEDDKEYVYAIKNTGGQARNIDIELFPFIYINQWKNGIAEPIKYSIINVPGLYETYKLTSDDIIISFKDYKFNDYLADDYIRYLISVYNISTLDVYMSSRICYFVQVFYYNSKNERKIDTFVLARKSDTRISMEKTVLYIDPELLELYQKEQNNGKTITIDSLNLNEEQIIEELNKNISILFTEFGQRDLARDSNSNSVFPPT